MEISDFYKSLGMILEPSGSQLLGDCPFCGKKKFYVEEKRTVYSCKVCGASGNFPSIMEELFVKVFAPEFKKKHKKELSEYRGIPISAFDYANLGFNPFRKEIIMVVRKAMGKAVSIRRLAKGKSGKRIWMNVKEDSNWLIGCEYLTPEISKIFICEGEWDLLALRYSLRKNEQNPDSAIAVPGAGNHHIEWKPYFLGKDVITLYDNDEAGRQGCFSIRKKAIKGQAKTIRHLHWNDKPDGYDIHDLVQENLSDTHFVLEYISENSKSNPQGSSDDKASDKPLVESGKSEEEQKKLEPISHLELHNVFHKWLVLQNTDMIDVAMGVLWATYLPGDPLWMMFVAASGGGKSETLMSLTPWHKCHDASSMTSKSLASGFPGQVDVSLLARLEGRQSAVVIKDLTPMMKNESEFDEIIGILRDAYDGRFTKMFGNGIIRQYEQLNFGMLVGVTTIIDKFDSVALGERFVKFRPDHELNRDEDHIFEKLMEKGNMDMTKMRPELQEACLRSLAREFKQENIPEETVEFKRATWNLATICAKMRAAAPMNEYTGRQEAVPMSEPPFRLQKQFIKLAKGLALHFESNILMDDRIMSIVRRVAIHTPNIMATRVVKILYDRYNCAPVEIRDIVEVEPTLKPDTVRDVLDKLVLTCCVERFKTSEEKTVYRLNEHLHSKIEVSNCFKGLPKCDPLYRKKSFSMKKQVAKGNHEPN